MIPVIVEDNGLDDRECVPEWFEVLLEWLPQRQERSMYFECFDNAVVNLLLDLADEVGWDVVDIGEQAVLRFPAYGLSVRIDTEICDEHGNGGLFTIFCCDENTDLFW